MSRKATSWSYGPEVLGLKLTVRDLAFLHAVCWSIHPKLRRTRPLTSSGRGLSPQRSGSTITNRRALYHRLAYHCCHSTATPSRLTDREKTLAVSLYRMPSEAIRNQDLRIISRHLL